MCFTSAYQEKWVYQFQKPNRYNRPWPTMGCHPIDDCFIDKFFHYLRDLAMIQKHFFTFYFCNTPELFNANLPKQLQIDKIPYFFVD